MGGEGGVRPDGTRVVTTSTDRTAQLWDAATGKSLPRLEDQAEVVSAVFSPDGTCVVTASTDNTARVWDAETGKPLTSPLEHLTVVSGAAFSPFSTRAVRPSCNGTARVWDARPDGGTLKEWSAIAERSPFVLEASALVHRSSLRPKTAQ
jgi:WD40 repeat protein